ncbi:MAG: hypothetical protein JRD69_10320 [Deltaproteobacteria bacterium]|nr:hypothetical protein [Deltaproteobacteria bacterium]
MGKIEFHPNPEELDKRIAELEERMAAQEEEIDSILTDISDLVRRIYGEEDGVGSSVDLDFDTDGDWDL